MAHTTSSENVIPGNMLPPIENNDGRARYFHRFFNAALLPVEPLFSGLFLRFESKSWLRPVILLAGKEKPMNSLKRRYRSWRHGRKFVRAGRKCRFQGGELEIDGHVELGERIKIRNHVIMRTNGDGRIYIGDRSGISYYCYFEATKCIHIGRFTGIAEFTVIRDTNHLVFGTSAHWRLTPHIAEPIVIGDAVMITSRCYIGPGVAIGDGAVISPGSFVTKDIGPLEVWGGNPARKIGHRTKGPVAAGMRKRYQAILDSFGAPEQEEAYSEALDTLEAEAEEGVNHAAEKRDRLFEEFGIVRRSAAAAGESGSVSNEA
jgi:acetyltransferase-like isoleucine patch superfamily enzyme